MTTTLDRPRTEIDEQVDAELVRIDTPDYSGWFCIRTQPFPCPAEGCDFVATHLTVAHRILVWPASDDRVLLTAARDAMRLQRNPGVEEYQQSFGPCIAYDLWKKIGRPCHGKQPQPAGWTENWERL